MAARARNPIESVQPPHRDAAGRPRMASGAEGAAPSPALMLQQALSAELNMARSEPGKWPPVATVAFITVTCGAFWTAVGVAVSRMAG
jgi:hypothetical protein